MRTVSVKVQDDFLERIAKTKKPALAVAELIWNGLDADATNVQVNIEMNELTGIKAIRVSDDGHGITPDEAVRAFENLGGSWKRWDNLSKTKKRQLHGKAGRGRFQAFALGPTVVWTTRFEDAGKVYQYQITGSLDHIGTFTLDDPILVPHGSPGTTVAIYDMQNDFPSLLSDSVADVLAEHFALYLMKYTEVTISYNDVSIDPMRVVARIEDCDLAPVRMESGEIAESSLTVIEWKSSVSRSLVLCDEIGFPLHETQPGVQAPGFNFTAYLKSKHIRILNNENALALESMDADVERMLENAKDKLRQHFRGRTVAQSRDMVAEWIEADIYPYEGSPKDTVEQRERQVFDVLALNVNSYLADFERGEVRDKRLSFRLLRQAIEPNAETVLSILREVLDLSQEKQTELAELLQQTSLTAAISQLRSQIQSETKEDRG